MEPMADASSLEQVILNRAKEHLVPVNGCIELSPLCNMNCDMCYVRLSKQEQEQIAPLKSVEEWIEVGREMKKAGVLFLLLTGGEPLIYPDFKRLYLELQKMGMIITINTNGTLIDEQWVSFFSEHKPRRINITLYGAGEEAYERLCHYKDGYDKTIKAIQLLKDHEIDVRIGCSVTPVNKQDVLKVHDIAKELNIPLIMDSYMFPATRERTSPFFQQNRLLPEEAARIRIISVRTDMGEVNFKQYVQQALDRVDFFQADPAMNKMVCIAGRCSFAVNWRGDMFPCLMMNQPSENIFEQGFQKSWELIREKCEWIETNPKCSSCRYRSLCKICASSALAETGFWDGLPDYMCAYTKEYYRLLKLEWEEKEDEEIF